MGNFYNPVHVYFGAGSIGNLSAVIGTPGKKDGDILLLTRGGSFTGSPEHREILSQLSGHTVHEIPFTGSNPDIPEVCGMLHAAGDTGYGMVVAVGGGSVLDIGKTLAALRGMEAKKPEDLRRIIMEREYPGNRDACGWIAIPTTAGTGSEVTSWATIWDKAKDRKHSIDGTGLYAQAAIVDPNLTITLPVRPTVSSALDALCHATEAYWAKQTNEISRMYALRGITSIVRHLGKLVEEPENLFLRDQIAFGSLCAGLAFSNTKTTACHSISYPMTMMFGLDHGIAASLTLARVFQANSGAIREEKALLDAFGASDLRDVDEIVRGLYEKAGLAYHLEAYGIKEEDLERIAEKAYTKGRMDNNPVDINRVELVKILHDILRSPTGETGENE